MKLAIFLFLAGLTVTGCSAYPNKTNSCQESFVNRDSVMRKALGDSIYTILVDAKNVTASLKLKTMDNKNDSIVHIKVSKNDKYVLDFILSAPSNYESNDTVYGQYFPNFSLTFVASKHRKCVANFDFGLRKWNVCDVRGKEIVRFDMPTTDVLRMANKLFPDCTYFSELINAPKQ